MKNNNYLQIIVPVIYKFIFLILIFQSIIMAQEIEEICSFGQLMEEVNGGREINRPIYSNELTDVFNDHFVIHYTTDGSCTSNNNTEVEPDCGITTELAQQTLAFAESAYQVYLGLGWLMPPPDDYPDGDDRYDIYFKIQ